MSTPTPQSTPPAAGAAVLAQETPRSIGDLVATLVLDGVLILAALLLALLGFVGGAFAADGCSAGECGATSAGIAVMVIGPIAAAVLAIAASIVLLVTRRPAWWVPVAGLFVAMFIWLVIGPALLGRPL